MQHAGTERIADTLTWEAAVRSDLGVASRLLAGASPDGVYSISDARIVDQFMAYIDELGVAEALKTLKPEGVKREAIPAEMYVVLYFLRCLARIPSQESLPELLFSDVALMSRVGFNAHQLEMGVTQRGAAKRRGPRRNTPVDPEAMAKNVVKLNLEEVRAFVRRALQLMWSRQPVVSKKGLFIIDGTFIEPGETAKGAGRTSRSKSVRTTDGMKTVSELTFGFKMVWMWSAENGLPVAIAMGTAEVDERPFVQGLIRDAKATLPPQVEIGTLLIDRGFLDGPGLWAIAQAGIRWVIPARHDLKVYEEAKRAASGVAKSHVLHAQTRTQTVRTRIAGGGPLKAEPRTIEAIGVENCTTFTTYASPELLKDSEHRHRRRIDFVPPRINAVVLTREDGRKNVDLVLLTNGPVTRPLAVVDDYDERSLVENQGHRELKQAWHLEHPVQRTAKATEIHMNFVVLAYALTQSYRAWLDDQVREDDAGRPTTLGGHVRRIEAENRDKLIVFVGEEYGIYFSSEYTMLLGRQVTRPNPKGASNLDALLVRLRGPPPSA